MAYKLPVTMDPLKYGNNPIIISESLYIVTISALTTAKIEVKTDGLQENHVELIRSGNLVLSYTDKLINDTVFVRTIGKNEYTYHFDQKSNKWLLELFIVRKVAKKFQPLVEDKNINNKVITMDLETFVSPTTNKLIPYLISFFDGKVSKSYYLTDYNNFEEMLQAGLNDLMIRKYHGYKIYLHNFAKFDAIFLIKELIKLGVINPIIHRGRIISVILSFFNENKSKPYKLTFRDSLLLLLSSLKKLGKFFKVEQQKEIFPHKFVTIDNLNYTGEVPAFEYFDNITLEEYNSYSAQFNNNWCMKTEAIKYCEIDCISLYQIMIKFINMMWDLYKTRISYPKDDPMNYIQKILSNSLYGKMGMDDSFNETLLIPKEEYLNFETKWADKIMDIISLDDNYLIQVKPDDTKDLINPLSGTHNINVAIANAITAYARIFMTQFKNNPKLKLFYTDTDSVYTNLNPDQMNELFPDIVNNKELGKLKLENVSKKARFIAPKVYYLKTIDNKEIFKVKGLNRNISLTETDFDNLLMKDNFITLNHSKLYRLIDEGTIEIINLIYTLQQTENKRKLIYSKEGILINTKPFNIETEFNSVPPINN